MHFNYKYFVCLLFVYFVIYLPLFLFFIFHSIILSCLLNERFAYSILVNLVCKTSIAAALPNRFKIAFLYLFFLSIKKKFVFHFLLFVHHILPHCSNSSSICCRFVIFFFASNLLASATSFIHISFFLQYFVFLGTALHKMSIWIRCLTLYTIQSRMEEEKKNMKLKNIKHCALQWNGLMLNVFFFLVFFLMFDFNMLIHVIITHCQWRIFNIFMHTALTHKPHQAFIYFFFFFTFFKQQSLSLIRISMVCIKRIL